jgi:hypothetical protein
MEDHTKKIIDGISFQLENGVIKISHEVLQTYDLDTSMEIIMEVMVNLSSSLLAKALLICEPSKHEQFILMVEELARKKAKEGTAVVETYNAINRAMTCSPPKNNH